MDKYTKFILTMIAVGIIGINFQLFGGDIISSAEANHARGDTNALAGIEAMHVIIDNWPGCN